jgi:hypothetical protein
MRRLFAMRRHLWWRKREERDVGGPRRIRGRGARYWVVRVVRVVRKALGLRGRLVVVMLATPFGAVIEVALWHLCLRQRRRRATSSL